MQLKNKSKYKAMLLIWVTNASFGNNAATNNSNRILVKIVEWSEKLKIDLMFCIAIKFLQLSYGRLFISAIE